jgi:A/G-specific adenine glycosylase
VTDGRHLFSHVEWHMRGYLVKTAYFEAPPGYLWVHAHMLREEIALPSAFRPFAAFLPV